MDEQERTDDTIKVLAFGNSFSDDATTYIDDIARAVGYDSVEYFRRLYKKKTGITPGEYRKMRIGRI